MVPPHFAASFTSLSPFPPTPIQAILIRLLRFCPRTMAGKPSKAPPAPRPACWRNLRRWIEDMVRKTRSTGYQRERRHLSSRDLVLCQRRYNPIACHRIAPTYGNKHSFMTSTSSLARRAFLQKLAATGAAVVGSRWLEAAEKAGVVLPFDTGSRPLATYPGKRPMILLT
ncbi:MAG: twin-arginine translocation signal domain-containing protein, partial [Verrucomicrobiaceae bacterium]